MSLQSCGQAASFEIPANKHTIVHWIWCVNEVVSPTIRLRIRVPPATLGMWKITCQMSYFWSGGVIDNHYF